MRQAVTTALIRKLPPGPCDIWDTKLPRFVVRVRPNGTASYLANLGRGAWHTIGPVTTLAPHVARERARGVLSDAAKDRSNGRDPIAEHRRRHVSKTAMTLDAFVRDLYEPWALEHQKRGKETVQRVRTVFKDLLDSKLTDVSAWTIEKWRTERLKSPGKKPRPETINSHLTLLKSVLTKAVAWKKLAVHPIGDIKPIKTDKTGRIRYLAADEEQRLREALTARDDRRRLQRERANAWRHERGYEEWPAENGDHLTPIVLLALNTGLRKGEIFNLQWEDVDWGRAQLTVRGKGRDRAGGSKTRQSRYIPLNTEALDTLTSWRTASTDESVFVFKGRDGGERLDDIKKSWLPLIRAAGVKEFTFHDLRHTFASKLATAGVDLNTVRELLGHTDIKATLRYAHLAPEHKVAAVAKLLPGGTR